MNVDALIEIAFEDPTQPPLWRNVSADVRAWSVSRGRSSELDRHEAGTATVVLDNRHGAYDPLNSLSPHYPRVRPMRRLRIRASVDRGGARFVMRVSPLRGGDTLRGDVHLLPVFAGYIEAWDQAGEPSGRDATATLRCVDGFAALALGRFIWGYAMVGGIGPEYMVCGLPSSYNVVPDTGPPFIPDEPSGARVTRVLDCFGWPTEARDIAAGQVVIWGSDGTTNIKVDAGSLEHIQAVAETEGGAFFVAADGRAVFRDSAYAASPDPQEIWGDRAGELRYGSIELRYDVANLWNRIEVTTTREDLTGKVRAEDQTSQAMYYVRARTFTLLPTSLSTLNVRASALLARYKDPHLRIVRLSPRPSSADEWLTVLGHELHDLVTVRHRPPAGHLIEQLSRIEAIHVESRSARVWSVSWTLSAA